jgi:hypothetical protein
MVSVHRGQEVFFLPKIGYIHYSWIDKRSEVNTSDRRERRQLTKDALVEGQMIFYVQMEIIRKVLHAHITISVCVFNGSNVLVHMIRMAHVMM